MVRISQRSGEAMPSSVRGTPRGTPVSTPFATPRGTPRGSPAWLTPRPLGTISPSHTLPADELDVATNLWLGAQPLMEFIPAQAHQFSDELGGVQRVQSECELDSPAVPGEPLLVSARFYVLETRSLPNGIKRARIVLKGQNAPFGWLTKSQDGRQMIRSVHARPLYQVVKTAIVRRRFELTSEEVGMLLVGTRVHVVDTRRTTEGSLRVCVVLIGQENIHGWLTARKPHRDTVMIRALSDAELDPDAPGSPGVSRLSLPLPLYAVSPEPSGAAKSARGTGHFRSSSSRSSSRSSSSPRKERRLPPFASSTPRKGLDFDARGSPNSARGGSRSARSARSARSNSPGSSRSASPMGRRPSSPGASDADAGSPSPDGQKAANNAWQKKLGTMVKVTRKSAASALWPSGQVEQVMNEYLKKAADEDAKLDESKKTLPVRVGEALVAKKIKVSELVQSWAKRGEEPINKMEFRQHVRKLVKNPDSKQIDGLFEMLDEDHGGTIDVGELRAALKKLQDEASRSGDVHLSIKEKADKFRSRADEARKAVVATRLAEQIASDLEGLKGNQTVEARLGSLLESKVSTAKINDVVSKWDVDGDGEIECAEFVKQTKKLGLMAETVEIEGLFRSLDSDGSGSLDHSELKRALRDLMTASNAAAKEIKRLQKDVVEVNVAARTAQTEFKALIKVDEEEAVQEAQRLAALAQEKAQKALEAKAAREAARAEAARAEEEKKAAFEAKIAAKRGAKSSG